MKNKAIAITLLTLCFLVATSDGAGHQIRKTREAAKRVKLKSEPEIGMRLPTKPRPTRLLVTGSGGVEPAYEVEYRGVEFTVCAYRDMLIHHVSTSDTRFRTPEGIAVRDSLRKVLEVSKGKVVKEPGWAFFVRLESGWGAAFTQGESMTEGELAPDAEVSFLFRK
jgi:hypothetical protein